MHHIRLASAASDSNRYCCLSSAMSIRTFSSSLPSKEELKLVQEHIHSASAETVVLSLGAGSEFFVGSRSPSRSRQIRPFVPKGRVVVVETVAVIHDLDEAI